MTTPTTFETNYPTGADPDYPVNSEDNITLLASKIIRDVLVTRGEPIRRAQLWQAVELAMGGRSPDVDGVLKRDWFSNQDTGPGRWRLTDEADAGDSPFANSGGAVNLVAVVEYLRGVSSRRSALHRRRGRIHQDLPPRHRTGRRLAGRQQSDGGVSL